MDVDKRLDQVGLKGKENNMIVSLRFNITEYYRRSYIIGIMEQVREFVLVEVLDEQIYSIEKIV